MHQLNQNALVSAHFKRSEFACKCSCGQSYVDAELLQVLEAVRTHFNSPVTINSSSRCESHNSSVGGADNSAHLYGIAADIDVKGVYPNDVQDWLEFEYLGYGIGRYNTFTHIDVRGDKARW